LCIKKKFRQSVSNSGKKTIKELFTNNDISKPKLCSELLLGSIETNIEFPVTSKRKDISSFSSLKLTNEFPGFNQYTTMTSFHTNKNKAASVKTDQMLIPHLQKDNIGYLTKNYWTSDSKKNASPSKHTKITVPSRLKPFSDTHLLKNLKPKLK